MTYPKTDAKANFVEIEKNMTEFWAADNTFAKLQEKNANGKRFLFFDGPATPSSIPHIGHLGVSAVKDMVCRFNNMRGRNVVHQLGWDVHGLPTEVMVEKELGMQTKDIVAKYGIEEFCNMCRRGVMKYVGEWGNYLNRLGRWVDIGEENVYNTMNPEYMESVIWALKKLYDDGLLYKDFKVNPFDWKLGTVMSNSEASSEYEDVVDDAVTVWFELENGRRVLAWTTTPWTLPANSALAVNPNMEYTIMKDADGAEYIIATNLLSGYAKQFENAQNVGTISGADMVGLKYKPLFNYYDDERLYSVIAADYVSDASGTGIVHIAPAFGEEDYLAAKEIDPKFPVIVNVDDYGNFTADVKDWAGVNIFEANPQIMENLKQRGQLVKKEQYKHSYPMSPRTKVKLIYRATDAWYIDVPKIRDRLIELNKSVDWKSAGNRFSAWIEGARPWGISRNRFWGVPLPIWTNEAGDIKVFGSIAELNEFFGADVKDLHRATMDGLTKDGWKRIPDVLDAWFESGSMPFAAKHFPFENSEEVADAYISDYIIEGQDQTRGWFYTLMVLSTALFDRPAFNTISANGMSVDEHKKKMSKSVGNYVDPIEMLDTYGADSMRLYILGSNFLKAEPVPIDKGGKVFNDTIKNLLTPLWNAYHFFTLYANAGNVVANENSKIDNVMDKYIMSELNNLVRVANNSLSNYDPSVFVKSVVEFLDILNNWYIRRSRARFWNEEQGAFDTLYNVLTTVAKLIAPLAPFVSEFIYKNLTGDASVHLTEYPKYDENAGDLSLKEDMRRIQMIVSVGKQLREEYKMRNRLPLAKLTVAGINMADYNDIICDELNVKSVDFIQDVNDVADSFVYLITPKIGARLGGALRDIIPMVKQGKYSMADDKLIVGEYTLNADEFESRLTVKNGVPGIALPDNTAVIILDTNLNDELISEGLVNDALRFIQDTRKTVGLEVSNRIIIEYTADEKLANAVQKYKDKIMSDTLCVDLKSGIGEHNTEIEGYKFSIKITKA